MSIIDLEVREKYTKDTGKTWGEKEEHMAEICSYFLYGFDWNKKGNIVISDSYYNWDGIKGVDEIGFEFVGENTCGHFEYDSVDEMLKQWKEECIIANKTAKQNKTNIPFKWLVY